MSSAGYGMELYNVVDSIISENVVDGVDIGIKFDEYDAGETGRVSTHGSSRSTRSRSSAF
jgi:hypothetical protein